MIQTQEGRAPGETRVFHIPIAQIASNPDQPRRVLTPDSIRTLAESIRRHGQLTPILVRRNGEGYRLIAGQRRMKAMALLGRSHIDAMVLSSGECDSALIALVENVQREALHFLDEAEACRGIMQAYPITQERLAASLSISPSALANKLRLLRLPQSVRDEARRLKLSERHVRALLNLPSEEEQLAMARAAGEGRMSVRQLESAIALKNKSRTARPTVSRAVRDNRIIINALLDTVRQLNHIGVKVQSRVEEREGRIDVVVTIPLNT